MKPGIHVNKKILVIILLIVNCVCISGFLYVVNYKNLNTTKIEDNESNTKEQSAISNDSKQNQNDSNKSIAEVTNNYDTGTTGNYFEISDDEEINVIESDNVDENDSSEKSNNEINNTTSSGAKKLIESFADSVQNDEDSASEQENSNKEEMKDYIEDNNGEIIKCTPPV